MGKVPRCRICGRFCSSGTAAVIFDLVAMEPSHDIVHCAACTEKHGPAVSNARPADGDMSAYQGSFEGPDR